VEVGAAAECRLFYVSMALPGRLPRACVCACSDGISYFSPCFAGCTSPGSTTDPNDPDVFHDCACVAAVPATAKAGYCAKR
jgi:hypothetical protein